MAGDKTMYSATVNSRGVSYRVEHEPFTTCDIGASGRNRTGTPG